MTEGYRFEPLEHDARGYGQISKLMAEVFPGARHLTPRYFEWHYGRSPDGQAIGCNAFAGDELVGHMAAQVFPCRLEGEDRHGAYTVNGAVHPLHRGRKLQSRISAGIFEQAAALGCAFCLSTGNKWSTGPLLTRLKMLRPLQARIGFGLPRRRERSREPSLERIWSDEALRWRMANPERRYSALRDGDQAAILSPAGIPGTGAILYQGPRRQGLPELDRAPGPLRVWLGLDPDVDWKGSSFLPIPMRLRPSPLNLVYKDLTGGGFLPDRDRLVFRGLDFDAF
ncbi:MAG TPA: GNAT family N-acetyltransferase [Allosphingosinicella sp.]|nr:GNAT family N-acetyltransferase [Allosphingosinicella sp.]